MWFKSTEPAEFTHLGRANLFEKPPPEKPTATSGPTWVVPPTVVTKGQDAMHCEKIVSFRTAAELFDRARTREGGHKCRPILAVVSKAVATADATVAARE